MLIKLKRILKEGSLDLYHFGPAVAFARVRWILSDESIQSIKYRNAVLVRWLTKRYASLIETYRDWPQKEDCAEDAKSGVWGLWWQGEHTMPDIIRWCYESQRRAIGDRPLVTLDQESVLRYINFPECVWNQYQSGKLRIQHLADMIRVQLIKNYGGIWLDASVFCVREIARTDFEREVFSVKCEPDERFVSLSRWTTYAIGGRKGNVLCSFLNDLFIAHCESGKPFIDYYMFDCAIAVAYNTLPAVKEAIDSLPKQDGDSFWLDDRLNRQDLIRKDDLKNQNTIQKIGWGKWKENPPNQPVLFENLDQKEE